jgi:hypothetical protein
MGWNQFQEASDAMPRKIRTDSLYDEFFDPTNVFATEPRWFCYALASEKINNARMKSDCDWYDDLDTIQGILLLLFTWNFAARITKSLGPKSIRGLLAETKADLRSLEHYSIGERLWTLGSSAR